MIHHCWPLTCNNHFIGSQPTKSYISRPVYIAYGQAESVVRFKNKLLPFLQSPTTHFSHTTTKIFSKVLPSVLRHVKQTNSCVHVWLHNEKKQPNNIVIKPFYRRYCEIKVSDQWLKDSMSSALLPNMTHWLLPFVGEWFRNLSVCVCRPNLAFTLQRSVNNKRPSLGGSVATSWVAKLLNHEKEEPSVNRRMGQYFNQSKYQSMNQSTLICDLLNATTIN